MKLLYNKEETKEKCEDDKYRLERYQVLECLATESESTLELV